VNFSDWKAKVTAAIIVVGLLYFFGTIGWDVFVATDGIKCNTISEESQRWAVIHMGPVCAFVFLLGFLAGHVLWPQVVRVAVSSVPNG
jgi:hypothetical protein